MERRPHRCEDPARECQDCPVGLLRDINENLQRLVERFTDAKFD